MRRPAGIAVSGAQAQPGALFTLDLVEALTLLPVYTTAKQQLGCGKSYLTPSVLLLQMKSGEWQVPAGDPLICSSAEKPVNVNMKHFPWPIIAAFVGAQL